MTQPGAAVPSEGDQIEEHLTRVRASISFLTKLGVTILIVMGYLLVASGTLNHQDLITPRGYIKAPLFDVMVSVKGLFVFFPGILVLLHAYFLFERLRLAVLLRRIWPPPERRSEKNAPYLPVFLPAFLFSDPIVRPMFGRFRHMLTLAYLALTLLPVGVLLLVQRSYLPASDPLVTPFHRVCVMVDVLLVGFFYSFTFFRVKRRDDGPGLCQRIGGAILVTLLTFLVSVVLMSNGNSAGDRVTTRYPLDLKGWNPGVDGVQRPVRLATRSLPAARLEYADLSFLDLSETNLRFASMRNASLRGTDLRRADLYGADLRDADLRGALLHGADLSDTQLTGADFSGAILEGAALEGAHGQQVRFFAADLSHARLTAANLYRSDFRLADLRGAWLRAARLIDGQLVGCTMDSPYFLAVGLDLRGAQVEGVSGLPKIGVDLRSAGLAGTEIPEAALTSRNLKRDHGEEELASLRKEEGRLREYLIKESRFSQGVRERMSGFVTARMEHVGSRREATGPGGDEDTDSFHTGVADQLLSAACRNRYIADFIVDKVQGAYLPQDMAAERTLAVTFVDRDLADCPFLQERETEIQRTICLRSEDWLAPELACPQ